jgi:hypothetical protein
VWLASLPGWQGNLAAMPESRGRQDRHYPDAVVNAKRQCSAGLAWRESIQTKEYVLKITVRKPFKLMSPTEQAEVMKLVKSAVDAGKTVVLGDQKCFVCGGELGEFAGNIKKTGKGKPGLIVNLCDQCFNDFPGEMV